MLKICWLFITMHLFQAGTKYYVSNSFNCLGKCIHIYACEWRYIHVINNKYVIDDMHIITGIHAIKDLHEINYYHLINNTYVINNIDVINDNMYLKIHMQSV